VICPSRCFVAGVEQNSACVRGEAPRWVAEEGVRGAGHRKVGFQDLRPFEFNRWQTRLFPERAAWLHDEIVRTMCQRRASSGSGSIPWGSPTATSIRSAFLLQDHFELSTDGGKRHVGHPGPKPVQLYRVQSR